MVLSLTLAFGALTVGLYHREVAQAEEAFAASDAARADDIYSHLEKMLETGGHIPWIFDTLRADLRVRRIRISYWRGDYAAVLEQTALNGEAEKRLSPALRFIRANARARAITAAQSRETVIRDLGQSIGDYAKVMEADPALSDAAFNYEFLLLLRSDVASGRRPGLLRRSGTKDSPDMLKGALGDEGAKQGVKVPERTKVLVPKEGDEDPEKRGPEPGKGSATKKRG